jgi:hypothetical protein
MAKVEQQGWCDRPYPTFSLTIPQLVGLGSPGRGVALNEVCSSFYEGSRGIAIVLDTFGFEILSASTQAVVSLPSIASVSLLTSTNAAVAVRDLVAHD